MTARVYLDDNATTEMDPAAVEAMVTVMRSIHGNASSIHREGVEARLALERARRGMERALGAPRESLLFTSGGTESNVLALRGALAARVKEPKPHVVMAHVEHKAVLETLGAFADAGEIELTPVATDQWGSIQPVALAEVLRPGTALVTFMVANNEVGAISPVGELSRLVRERSPAAHVHVDAVQGAGRIPLVVSDLGVDTVAIAAHKFRGPKGVGGLFVKPGTRLVPMQRGGGQERLLRGGTENVAGVVGMAKALEGALADVADRARVVAAQRENLWRMLHDAEPRLLRNSPERDCLPGTLNISLPGADGRALVRVLDEAGFAISAGSACTSSGEATSHVLEALHPGDRTRVRGAVRISFAWPRAETSLVRFVEAFAHTSQEMVPR